MKKKGKYTAKQKDEILELAYRNKPIQITDNRTLGIVASLVADKYLDGWPRSLRMTAAGRDFYDKGGYAGAEKEKSNENLKKTLSSIFLVLLGAALSALIALLI
ncbi:MAG: hypothetical protein IKP02_07410 [Paludibacteraceae bacterium]|nr:hypothetical protein [Paludibacteraceae bacterium]